MKNKRSFLAGMVTAILLVSVIGTAAAANFSKTAELYYRDIKIKLNGQEIVPKDVDGNVVEPFIIDGTTYLPVRAVGDALGLNVAWDDTTSTVVLSETPLDDDANSNVENNDGKNHDIEITGATLTYSYGLPKLYLDFQNNTNSDIIRFDIHVLCYNAYGEQVGTMYNGYNMEKLPAKETGSQYWDLLMYSGVQEVQFGVFKYQTADSQTVEIPENEIKWWSTSY